MAYLKLHKGGNFSLAIIIHKNGVNHVFLFLSIVKKICLPTGAMAQCLLNKPLVARYNKARHNVITPEHFNC